MDKDKTLVSHADMIDCVKHGVQGPEVYAFTIDTLQESGSNSHKETTRRHTKQTFSLYDNKRYLTEDFHSLAYGHKDASQLIPMEEVIEHYHQESQGWRLKQGPR